MVEKRKRRVFLVQQGVWDMPVDSMPLASGYFKALIDADEALASEVEVTIFSFKGGDTPLSMVDALFGRGVVPDVVGFSVFGWNYTTFGKVAETFRQLNPDGWVVFGGTHVTHQAGRTFAMFPDVDVVVNGEGELTFRELLLAYLGGASRHELGHVEGISFKSPEGAITTTESRPRIVDLDRIPSPVLSGALAIEDDGGNFRYDVALMETNRGCPYKCGFCYWGGAVGQKLRKFSIDRLAAELDFYGFHKVVNIVLCDANFGMLREDQQFVEAMIRTREKYGFPRHFETSWAKNKGPIFYDIVHQMKQHGFRSSFTLALQTLEPTALTLMGRKNMKVNQWEDLARWLGEEGLDCYVELIWGVPGETYETFLEGYDRLARRIHRIATYPLLIMPNTEYWRERDKHGFVMVRGIDDDFQYLVSHKGMSLEDNKKAHRFLFWARVLAENSVLRHIWAPVQRFSTLTQSQLLVSLDQWVDRQEGATAAGLRACRAEIVDNLDASRVTRGIHFCYLEPGFDDLITRWWEEEILPRMPADKTEFFRELLRYDLLSRPILDHDGSRSRARVKRWRRRGDEAEAEETRIEEVNGEPYIVRDGVEVKYDIPGICRRVLAGEDVDISESPRELTLYYKVGFANFVDNHEFVVQFVGKTLEGIEEARQRARATGLDRQTSFGQRSHQ